MDISNELKNKAIGHLAAQGEHNKLHDSCRKKLHLQQKHLVHMQIKETPAFIYTKQKLER